MEILLPIYVGIAVVLWLSTYGYFIILRVIMGNSKKASLKLEQFPDIDVVIPILNEEHLITGKLADLKRTDYPKERITVLIVDGGSADRSPKIVQSAIAENENISFITVNQAKSKAEQVAEALQLLNRDIVVLTDADSMMSPSCIRELINVLQNDPTTAIVGAAVEPDGILLEERIHWWFLNYVWWLEGEALSSASLSGVCYACRREWVLPVFRNARAEDINLAFAAAARGFRVRICLDARVKELRVPKSLKEIIDYRHRRGTVYLYELRQASREMHSPLGRLIACNMRIWHFTVIPKAAILFLLLGLILLCGGYSLIVLSIALALILPLLVAPVFSPLSSGENLRRGRLIIATSRLIFITMISLLTMKSKPANQGPLGGKR